MRKTLSQRKCAVRSKDKRARALSIRQPNAEAILRGIKKTEYRTGATNFRGRFLIYASRTRYSLKYERQMMRKYGIRNVLPEALPRGVIVGSAILVDCSKGNWHLKNPRRAKKLRVPR